MLIAELGAVDPHFAEVSRARHDRRLAAMIAAIRTAAGVLALLLFFATIRQSDISEWHGVKMPRRAALRLRGAPGQPRFVSYYRV